MDDKRTGSSAFFTSIRNIGHNVSETSMPKGVGAVEPWRLCLDVRLKIDGRRSRRAIEVQAGSPCP
jgi:hypothetical protein